MSNESESSNSKVNIDNCDISDSDEESETFDPMPYAFILEDVHRKQLILSSDRLQNATVSCPSFHLLLDHTVAVLWCFYSEIGHNKLGTSQLHWAIQFLDGLVDNKNRHTTDVDMAIEHLENALIDVAATIDETDIVNRQFQDEEPLHFSMLNLSGETEYFNFGTDLINKSVDGTRLDNLTEEEKYNEETTDDNEQSTFFRKSLYDANYEQPSSITLNDMLEDHQDIMTELLQDTRNKMENENNCSNSSSVDHFTNSMRELATVSTFSDSINSVSSRNITLRKALEQMEQIRTLLISLNDKCPPSS